MRKHDILNDLEREYGTRVDSNFDPGILCDGDSCRSPECECWGQYETEVRAHLLEKRIPELKEELGDDYGYTETVRLGSRRVGEQSGVTPEEDDLLTLIEAYENELATL